MKSFRDTGKEGFSPVEFIFVIAVMALVILIMAPWLIKSVDKSNITFDRQRADDVRVAVREAMEDPEVWKDADSKAEIEAIVSENNTQEKALSIGSLAESDTVFAKKVAEKLNLETEDLIHVGDDLKSKPKKAGGMEIQFWIKEDSVSYVRTVITNSDDGLGNAIVSG